MMNHEASIIFIAFGSHRTLRFSRCLPHIASLSIDTHSVSCREPLVSWVRVKPDSTLITSPHLLVALIVSQSVKRLRRQQIPMSLIKIHKRTKSRPLNRRLLSSPLVSLSSQMPLTLSFRHPEHRPSIQSCLTLFSPIHTCHGIEARQRYTFPQTRTGRVTEVERHGLL